MDKLTDIDRIISILDAKVDAGVGRIKVEIDETIREGSVSEQYHHGRCDVCSPFATGIIKNEEFD